MGEETSIFQEIGHVWASGGWLMVPLFLLTVFIYYTAFELLIRLNTHALLRLKVHKLSDADIHEGLNTKLSILKKTLLWDGQTAEEVRRHFNEVNKDNVPIINRRIKSLSVIITSGPLVGLLGTVTGMLSTFEGMGQIGSEKFESTVSGISEALITTQAGLIISIPAMIILSIILMQRNTLVHCIARLERYNTMLVLEKRKS